MNGVELSGGFVNGVSRTEDSGVVLKEFKDLETMAPKKVRFGREVGAGKKLSKVVPIPEILDIDPDSLTLTMKFIPNCPPLDQWLRDNPKQISKVLAASGQLLLQVHQSRDFRGQNLDLRQAKLSNFLLGRLLKKSQNQIVFIKSILEANDIQTTRLAKLISLLQEKVFLSQIQQLGVGRIHGDFWLNNILFESVLDQDISLDEDFSERFKGIIDWENSKIGLLFEDFAIVHLWIEMEQGDFESFWKGYNIKKPQNFKQIVKIFTIIRCVEFLSKLTLSEYRVSIENDQVDNFYKNKIEVIKMFLNDLKTLDV